MSYKPRGEAGELIPRVDLPRTLHTHLTPPHTQTLLPYFCGGIFQRHQTRKPADATAYEREGLDAVQNLCDVFQRDKDAPSAFRAALSS